jgi:hypothetical protein
MNSHIKLGLLLPNSFFEGLFHDFSFSKMSVGVAPDWHGGEVKSLSPSRFQSGRRLGIVAGKNITGCQWRCKCPGLIGVQCIRKPSKVLGSSQILLGYLNS